MLKMDKDMENILKIENNCFRIKNNQVKSFRLPSHVTIPDGVTSIGDYTFHGCRRLKSITIPDGVTSIGDYAFYGCRKIKSISIPDSVTSIGDYTFSGCTSLNSIRLPKKYQSLEQRRRIGLHKKVKCA